jgi:hypothetical protein
VIVFSDHAKDKLLKELRKLGVTARTVREVLRRPDEVLFDALRNRFVVVCWARNVAVVYEKSGGDFVVITVIYSSELKEVVNKRRMSGRWI